MTRHFVLRLNPEPWAVGDISVGRKGGKTFARMSPNPNLVAYQSAVKDELRNVTLIDGEGVLKIQMMFLFWRQQVRYVGMDDRVRQRNQADATNLQKGLEDALQGVLFSNDRHVVDIRSVIIDQGPDVDGKTIIVLSKADDLEPMRLLADLPQDVLSKAFTENKPEIRTDGNSWGGDDLF